MGNHSLAISLIAIEKFNSITQYCKHGSIRDVQEFQEMDGNLSQGVRISTLSSRNPLWPGRGSGACHQTPSNILHACAVWESVDPLCCVQGKPSSVEMCRFQSKDADSAGKGCCGQ